ncbi:uncharacterized protein LOC131943725 [Physella acuta]|uniref:uncharacterized protein LOC131943725 n=1 Tax=Physella acuta TaxID=109671 RepID=UPI0027DBC638|nr:uncharacterized protein LOC131943725 [Physella acuta]
MHGTGPSYLNNKGKKVKFFIEQEGDTLQAAMVGGLPADKDLVANCDMTKNKSNSSSFFKDRNFSSDPDLRKVSSGNDPAVDSVLLRPRKTLLPVSDADKFESGFNISPRGYYCDPTSSQEKSHLRHVSPFTQGSKSAAECTPFDRLGALHTSIRNSVFQDHCIHCRCQSQKSSRSLYPSLQRNSSELCYCEECDVFSPLWEWTYPNSDELYFDCLEPGDYTAKTADESISRNSSSSSFKSIPQSPEPSAMASPEYVTPLLSASYLPATSTMFTFCVTSPPSSYMAPSSPSSTHSSSKQPPSMPVVTLFNHSVNFWHMEID